MLGSWRANGDGLRHELSDAHRTEAFATRKEEADGILKDMATGSVAGLIGIMAHVGTAQFMWDWTKRTSPEHIKCEQ